MPANNALVVGAGGIGGIVAAGLAQAGVEVTAVSTNPAIRKAVADDGIRVRQQGQEYRVRATVVATPAASARYRVIVLATQPPQVEDAARQALPHLDDGGVFVVLQNGLCEERLAAIVGADRVVGAIVAWGASMLAPGVYEKTAGGGFTVGRLDRGSDAAVERVRALLDAVAPARTTPNLRGARWSKLALNCAISSLGTIGGERLGALVQDRHYRRLALALMTEVTEVAVAEGVHLEKVAGTLDLGFLALTPSEKAGQGSLRLATKHALLFAVGMRYRRMRSSMLSAIERGRVPSVDFLNGEVVTRGQRHRIATPINRRVVELVWSIARGQAASSRALLDQLAQADAPKW
jgi:2-dehydropantoate 2-reductase